MLKNILNSKVNNWAVKLETFNIHFEYISEIWNTVTLSKIIGVDPDMKPDTTKEEYEFGYSCFKELPPAEVFNVEEMVMKKVKL